MAKVPVSSLPLSKPNTTSSAWTRLVQTTKTASKTPQHGDRKSPSIRRQSSQTSAASSSASSSRPMKRRRVTGRKSQSAPGTTKRRSPPAAASQHEADHAEKLTPVPATETSPTERRIQARPEHVGTCAASKEESSLSDRECDSYQPIKPRSAFTGVSSSSPTHSDLHAFWGPVKESTHSKPDEKSQRSYESTDTRAGKACAAAKSAEGERKLDLVDESSRQEITVDLPRQSPGEDLMQNATSGLAQQDITDTNSKIVTKSSFLRRSPRTRQRSKLKHETGRLDDEDGHKGHAGTADKEFKPAVNLHADEAHTVLSLSGASPRASTTPGLHESPSQAGSNSLSDPDQIITHPLPQSSASASNDKENAVPTRKAKRRLTLHDTQSHHQQKRKKSKVAPKQTVQTTLALAIGGNAGMRECKVCDTVYNPLHPEDVKVHAKRHAGVVRKERRYAET